MWTWVFVLAFFFLVFGGMQTITRLIEGRRKFLLDMKEQEARVAEARAKEQEIQQQRAELEYREALLEIERFDRRTRGEQLPPQSPPPERPPPGPPTGAP